jgi:hypothetical protein
MMWQRGRDTFSALTTRNADMLLLSFEQLLKQPLCFC